MQTYKTVDRDINDITYSFINKKRDRYCNNIFAFDIEVSSFFRTEKGVIPFDKSKDAEFYKDCEKLSLCYIWQFAIDGFPFYGRELSTFKTFLDDLSEVTGDGIKIIYVHNLSYEFQFLRNIFDNIEVFARKERHPFYFRWRDYEFRCSYMLTRLSLAQWAKNRSLQSQKQVGDLDYLKPRTPYTRLSDKEMGYCIADVKVVCEGIAIYKEQYKNVCDIPLTQTGVVRKSCERLMSNEISYNKKMATLYPDTIEEMQLLVDVFMGGYTHANLLSSGFVIDGVASFDITSSYPWAMLSERYPMTKFCKISSHFEQYMNDDRYCYIVEFVAFNIDSRLSHTYLSKSKCIEITGGVYDNGRVLKAKSVKAILTNVDYEIFTQAYTIEKTIIIDFYIAKLGYLNATFCRYILELFNNKTVYKGDDEHAELYMKSKEELNSLFGMCVTRDITDEVLYNGEWYTELLNSEIYNQKVRRKKRNLKRNYTTFSHGMWITAHARRNLWKAVLYSHSDDIIYMDTDSHKVENYQEHLQFYEEYNADIRHKQEEIAKRLNVDISLFRPISPKGKVCSIGEFDLEDVYLKFKTLGAKKYIYETDDGLHMTVSGVRKSAVSQISDINDFSDNLVFDIDHANKLLMNYNDNQQAFVANAGRYDEYFCTDKYGICAQPTTYALSQTSNFDYMSNYINDNITRIFYRKGRDL